MSALYHKNLKFYTICRLVFSVPHLKDVFSSHDGTWNAADFCPHKDELLVTEYAYSDYNETYRNH